MKVRMSIEIDTVAVLIKPLMNVKNSRSVNIVNDYSRLVQKKTKKKKKIADQINRATYI